MERGTPVPLPPVTPLLYPPPVAHIVGHDVVNKIFLGNFWTFFRATPISKKFFWENFRQFLDYPSYPWYLIVYNLTRSLTSKGGQH